MTFRAHTARIATFAIAALALSSCGSSGGDDAGSQDSTGNGPVTIEYLHRLPDGDGMTKVADIVAKWNADNPDIQVTATKFDGKAPELILKLENDVRAGTAPCLAQVGYGEIPQLFVKGQLKDVKEQAEQYEDNYAEAAYKGVTVGDAVVGLPQDVAPLVYYYNAGEFERLGIDVPEDADDLKDVAEKAAADGKYALAWVPDQADNWLTGQAAATGDEWFSTEGDQWKVETDGDGTQKLAQLWQEVLDNDRALVTERFSDSFDKALTDGQLIGHIGAAWEAGFMLDPLDGGPQAGQWRVAQLPELDDDETTGPFGGSGVAVTQSCEHPTEAMKFNDWFNTQIEDLNSQGLVTAAKGEQKTSEKMTEQFGGQDVAAEFTKATEHLNSDWIFAPGFTSLQSMNEVAAQAGAGTAKVEDVFTTAEDTAVKAIKDLGLPVEE